MANVIASNKTNQRVAATTQPKPATVDISAIEMMTEYYFGALREDRLPLIQALASAFGDSIVENRLTINEAMAAALLVLNRTGTRVQQICKPAAHPERKVRLPKPAREVGNDGPSFATADGRVLHPDGTITRWR